MRLLFSSIERRIAIAATGLLLPLSACQLEGPTNEISDIETIDAIETTPMFVDVATSSGLDFVHENGASGKFFYPEIVQGGAALFDYDDDSFLDIYLVQSGSLPGEGSAAGSGNRLFRNRGDGTFEDRTSAAGVSDPSYGSGAAAADFDRDGLVDLYVTNLGANRLYRNRGDGSFEDVTERAAVGDPGYSTSAAFFDYDADGDLDLYVCNYVVWSARAEKPCLGRAGMRSYCNPSEYLPQADSLFANDGDGTFTDVSELAGIAQSPAAGLGVATGDFDGDGWQDVYVANDQMPNFLFLNNGDGTFREEGLLRGVALNERGQAEASMGVVSEDTDGDGDWDLFTVHLSGETNTFYRNDGGAFRDTTDELGLGMVSQPSTGFGVGLFDYDNDSWLDVFIANGRVSPGDSVENDFREPNQLLRRLPDGIFQNVSKLAGEALALNEVSRGAAFGDVDNDGDIDILVVNNGGPVRLFENRGQPHNHWLTIDLDGGRRFGRIPIGAIVTVETAGRRQRRQCQPGYGYATSNDPRLHFGLGDAPVVERIVVTWPDGSEDAFFDVAVDQFLKWTFGQKTKEGLSGESL